MRGLGAASNLLAVAVMVCSCSTPLPTITSVSPAHGTTAGGTSVLVSGTAFAEGDVVSFGGVPATQTLWHSAASLFATAPAHAAGVVDVTVTTTGGDKVTLAKAYEFIPPTPSLSLTSVSPASGTSGGGTAVTLTGSGFVAGDAVLFGGVPAGSVTVSAATSLTATTPPHAAGAVDVSVVDPGGNTATLAGAFTYQSGSTTGLALSAVSPSMGSVTGGTTVTLTGTGFAADDMVTFDGVAATDITVISSSSLTAIAPAHTAGAVNVTVTSASGESAVLPNAFTY